MTSSCVRSIHFAALLVAMLTVPEPCVRASAAGGTRPNVLFIVVDDLNDWVGVLGGHPNALTPNIDRLAERGVLFTNAHAQSPICGPSRASFLSGLYPYTTGLYQQPVGGNTILRSDERFFHGRLLPQYLAEQGYLTMGGGKITHGYPLEAAFHRSMRTQAGSGPKPNRRFAYQPPDGPYSGTQTDWGAYPERDEDMPDHQIADWAIEQLKTTHDKPFFLAVGFRRPHVPWYVPRRWLDRHPIERIELPAINDDDFDDIPETGRRVHEMPKYPQLDWIRESGQIRYAAQAYLASTTFVDHQIGRVIDALANSRYSENTIIVLFSDHGYHLGEKHQWSKHGLWEESTRVPLIVVRPDDQLPQKSNRPVGLIDLYPTILELAGVPARDSNEGRSLVPLLEDPDAPRDRPILTNYGRGNNALRTERFRYIRYEDSSEELYDHANDPNEWVNLAGDPEFVSVVESLRTHLPEAEAPYHPGTQPGPVNAWFAEHLSRHGITE